MESKRIRDVGPCDDCDDCDDCDETRDGGWPSTLSAARGEHTSLGPEDTSAAAAGAAGAAVVAAGPKGPGIVSSDPMLWNLEIAPATPPVVVAR